MKCDTDAKVCLDLSLVEKPLQTVCTLTGPGVRFPLRAQHCREEQRPIDNTTEDMSQCLYESLRAVGLQHHYNRLSSVGVRSVAHLTVLTLDDFPLLGIKSMEDRTRLFHLVRELRTLDAETLLQAEIQEDACYVLPSPSNSAQKRRKTNKPTVDKENVQKQKTPVYQANLSEYSYGLPQASAPPSPSKRRPGEPRIWVCVRKRPLTSAEERRKETDVVTSAGQSCVLQESRAAVDLTHYKLQHRFFFDHVFGEACSNEEVYLRTAQPLVQHMLQGGSATCFAYGQTGAGKTHTMLGCSPVGPSQSRGRGELGLYSLAVKDLFSHLSSSPALTRLTVFVSFFEIYCGQLYDLLDHRNRLFAREDGCGNVHIAGLCHKRVESVDSLLQVISRGTEHRSQGSSGVNPVSSRSHALLQIQLRGAGQSVHGRMWFVDLAGSERASDSGDPDRRSRLEGAEINQSLLALKECIRSLDQEQGHTPFRQSKLTQVLKDSFVGDSMTCMIANISPGHSSTEHTLNTLRYADRVKELKGQKGQRKGRRVKNISESPKLRTLSQNRSSGTFRSGFRDSSPSKRAKTSSTVLTDPSPEEQEPSSVSNLNIIQEYVEESVWEPEEGADDSYLDVPQAISSSMIPWAIQFHSQRLGGTTATEQSVSPENALILHKSHKKSTAPPPAQAESSSTDVLKTPSSSEAWTSGAHWHIVQAHMETLQQMQRLSHSEGTLLVQQPDMGFDEYVQQLEQIMRRKALCVRSLISHLQPYLKTTLQHSADRL
uniref:Kinesin-like protein n=1 Tax=Knipowitschia caucasica TaxID=637954 RepID=A0AAV2MPS5_KNICA